MSKTKKKKNPNVPVSLNNHKKTQIPKYAK